jgi:hypothetical protein
MREVGDCPASVLPLHAWMMHPKLSTPKGVHANAKDMSLVEYRNAVPHVVQHQSSKR